RPARPSRASPSPSPQARNNELTIGLTLREGQDPLLSEGFPALTSSMRRSRMRQSLLAAALVVACTVPAFAQDDDAASSATMRPVIRGRQAAVASMKPEATE